MSFCRMEMTEFGSLTFELTIRRNYLDKTACKKLKNRRISTYNIYNINKRSHNVIFWRKCSTVFNKTNKCETITVLRLRVVLSMFI